MPAKKSDDTKKTTTTKTTKSTTKKTTAAKKPVATTKKTTTAKRTAPKKAVKKTPSTTKKTTTRKRVTKATAKTKASQVMNAVEKQFDEGMADTQKFIKKNVSKKTKQTVSNLSKKAEGFASSVEHLGEEVEQFTDSIFPMTSGSQGVYNAQFHKKLSRLFIFRFLRWVVQWPVIAIWGVWYMIVTIIHYVQMFITGKRSKYLWNKQVRFWKHVTAWKSYLNALTDARPEIIHPPVK